LKSEQYNRFLESSIVSFIGVFFSYFLSFVVGAFPATILGCMFAFWGILSPEFKARQRNWEFLGGRGLVDPWTVDADAFGEDRQGLYGSIFLGRVDDACVVEDTRTASADEFDLDQFQDYTMDSDELEQFAGTPYLIRVRLSDAGGRELQIHARMSEEYLDIERGMPVAAVLLSKSQTFSSLAALTDVLIPAADCWVGDYPYLNRPEMEALLAEDDELWDMLQSEGLGGFTDETDDFDDNDNFDERDNYYTEDSEREKVPVRRKRR
jgi:hypothetical protein